MLYRVNGGDFLEASGTTEWHADITLVPGSNLIEARSIDSSGNESKIAVRTITFVVLTPISITVVGEGKVVPIKDGDLLEIGRRYTVNAVARPGWVFNGWSGSTNDSRHNLKFVMQEGFNLTAQFIPDPFRDKRGQYLGGVGRHDNDDEGHDHKGKGDDVIVVNVTSSGAFSGRIGLGETRYVLTGKFNNDGSFARLSRPRNEGLVQVRLLLTSNGETPEIQGIIETETNSATITAHRIGGAPKFKEKPKRQAVQLSECKEH